MGGEREEERERERERTREEKRREEKRVWDGEFVSRTEGDEWMLCCTSRWSGIGHDGALSVLSEEEYAFAKLCGAKLFDARQFNT